MSYSNISITLPPGYVECLEDESQYYGLNRSEFLRILFDGFLYAKESARHATPELIPPADHLFPHILPHRRTEAEAWLEKYLRLIVRIAEESEQRKRERGDLDRMSVSELLPRSPRT